MTTLRALDHVIASGPFGEPWHPAPAVDAWLRTSRGVLAALNDEVRRLDVAWHQQALMAEVLPGDGKGLEVVVRRQPTAVRAAQFFVPARVSELPAAERAGLVAAAWSTVLEQLGLVEVAAAVSAVREPFWWYGSPRPGVGGTLARVRACFADDGFARLVVQVRGADASERTSLALVGWCTTTSMEAAQLSLKAAGDALLVEPCVDAWERSTGVQVISDQDLTPVVEGDPLADFAVAPVSADVPVTAQTSDEVEDVMAVYSEVMAAGLEAGQRPLDVPTGFVSR